MPNISNSSRTTLSDPHLLYHFCYPAIKKHKMIIGMLICPSHHNSTTMLTLKPHNTTSSSIFQRAHKVRFLYMLVLESSHPLIRTALVLAVVFSNVGPSFSYVNRSKISVSSGYTALDRRYSSSKISHIKVLLGKLLSLLLTKKPVTPYYIANQISLLNSCTSQLFSPQHNNSTSLTTQK